MNPAAWTLFLDAAELGSLSKVALLHGTSQPQVSRQIGELERQCGGRLFQRNGRGVALTELGRRISPRVREWLASALQFENDIRSTVGIPIGRIRVGVLPSVVHPLMSALYQRVKTEYPLVNLSVREGQGAQLDTWLEEGGIDLAVLYRHSPTPKNGDVYLTKTHTYLIGAPGDPLTAKPSVPFSALNNLPLVSFCRPSGWRDRLDQLASERGISLNVVLEADSRDLQARVVADAGVYALLGANAVAAAGKLARFQATKVVKPEIVRYLAVAMSRHGEMSLACKTVLRELRTIGQATFAA
jgi:LysR family transcriptional regulator, nitrogen assimilation regulatory protein